MIKTLSILLFTLFYSLATQAFEAECGERFDTSKYAYAYYECDDMGQRVARYEYLKEDDRLVAKFNLDEKQRVVERIGYSSNGSTYLSTFAYKSESYIKTHYERDSAILIKSKREFDLITDTLIKEWAYEQGTLKYIDTLNSKDIRLIDIREIVAEKKRYYFSYRENTDDRLEIESFVVLNEFGEQVGEYDYKIPEDYEVIIKSKFPLKDHDEILRQFNDSSRMPVAIIDSGFDVRHPMIVPYLSPIKADQPFDNINDELIKGSLKPIPMSHGTHVASIALKGRKEARLVGFPGDVGDHNYLMLVGEELRKRNIKLVNMSWGFKSQGRPMTPSPRTYTELQNVIVNNPQALFHVAAGNNGWSIDKQYPDYPASYSFPNLLVVGALNVSDYDWKDSKNIMPAQFKSGLGSNYGKVSVDVFAPGKKVVGALLGGGSIALSGTSMASPYVLNTTISVANILPELSSLELKEIMMKSVGYPENRLPCLSQGFIHPKRAMEVAKLMASSDLTVEEAVLQVRKNLDLNYIGEVEIPLDELEAIWQKIDLSLKN